MDTDPPPPDISSSTPPNSLDLLSILPPRPSAPTPRSSKSLPTRGLLSSKILPSSTSAAFPDPDNSPSPLEPLLSLEPVHSPGDSLSDSALSNAHAILWNHFGFIPNHPDLDLDGYKLHSPLAPPSVNQRNLPANLSRTSISSSLHSSLPKMAKKRRSLQAILVPSFLPQASSSSAAVSPPPSRARSHTVTSPNDLNSVEYSPDWLAFYSGTASPGSELSSIGPVTPSRNSPPPDLLDEDPFANLSPAPSVRGSRATSPVRSGFDVFSDGLEPAPVTPRSPLAQTAQLEESGHRVLRHASSFTSFQAISHPPSTPPPTPTEPSKPLLIRRPKSSGPPQVRPAYTRPAFAPRPSLPSLNTLARTSIHIPKVRRGRPGAHLPLEPWEDPAPPPLLGSSELSEPPSPMATRSVPSSPPARRRGHLRRPTLSMIRDSRMFLDGESADDGGVPPLELESGSEDKESSSARATPTPEPRAVQDAESLRGPNDEWEQTREREDVGMGTSFLSISPEDHRGVFHPQVDLDQPPTPPPKSPGSLTWHARSVSETSTTSTCTVPSLCPSSPTSTSSESADHPHFHLPSHSLDSSDPLDDPRSLRHPHPHHDSYHPHSHPHVHIDTEPAEHTTYPSVFAPHPFQHHRDTQLLTSDLLASLEYDYSEALSRLSVAAATGLNVPLAPCALFPGSSSSSPAGDFEPGSSAGTIRNIAIHARTASSENDDGASSGNTKSLHHHHPRLASDDSAESKWSTEATDAHVHAFLHAPFSPVSPPELPSSSSEPSTGTTSPSPSNSCSRSPSLSPCTPLSRSRSSSTVSSEYDFGDEEYGYYSYDLGPFADPLDAPAHEQQHQDPLRASPQHPRPVFGYGIPWPSTHHRTSAASGGSGGSVSDVLSDLEDLAEDLTERFSLSMQSAATSVRSSELYADAEDGECDVFSSDDGLADADGYSSSSRRNGRPSGSSSQGHSYNGGGSSNGHNGYSRNGGSTFRRGSAGHGGNDGDDDDDDERRKRRPARLPLSVTASVLDSETSEDEEDEEEESSVDGSPRATRMRQRHDTTRPGMYVAAPPPSASVPIAPASPGAADDDVPLARQIPTALKAQRTIRRQVRDELDQKRQERRAARAQQALLTQPAQQQQQQQQPTRALSSAAEMSPPPVPPTGSSPPRPSGRPRTRTLPSTVSSPFSVGDLTKKLLGLQAAPAVPATAPPMPPATARSKRPSLEAHEQHGYASASASSARGRTMTADPHMSYTASSSRAASRAPPPDAGRSLRPTRSFHRPRTGDADAYIPPPIPTTSERTSADLQRRTTTASRHRPEEPPAFLSTAPAPPDARTVAALDRARSLRSAKSSSSRRPSLEKAQRPEPESISASRTRPPTAAASPASTFAQPAGKGAGQMMWQQRIFIGNMQRFCLVEIGSGTSAGDVLGMVDAQGALDQGAGSGGWMLWEVSQDFGMERPIRSFEMLSDVCGAWNTDKTVNLLVIKKTLLAPLLNPKAMPSASPMCSGYVQWEYKRGKWQKRWMELREHSLWLSKRDTGKDATFLCSLNNFDAYYVTRVHKAPKPYVFSVKSTDSLSFFESTSDYVHVFSCGEGEGKNWLEKILLARSYVLYQERNVLSSQSASGTATATGGGLQRSGTRKQAPGQRPAQPLVNVSAPKADPLSVPSGFEPAAGSLLARRHG